MIRAKFKVESVRRDMYKNEHVSMTPCHGPGNETWSKATPGGKIELMISNPDAQGKFEPGRDYFADFTPAGE